MLRLFTVLFSTITILGCQESADHQIDLVLYPSQLQFGQYKVGFTNLWAYDITRPPIQYSDWNGKLYPTKETKGRQFQINIWYPSEDQAAHHQVVMEDYLNLSFRQINFNITEEDVLFGKEELVSKLHDLGGPESTTVGDINKLEPLKCYAFHDAKPSTDTFPLILYPNGLSPISNSVTAEYLASYGFVVVVFAIKGELGFTADTSTKGAAIAEDDINFVLSEVLKLPYVDKSQMGVIGNAIESSFCMAYQTKHKTIDAFVSLEGGFISQFEQRLLEGLPFYESTNFDIPSLMIYSPHPSINPTHIENLIYADRYFAHFPQMREFDYLNIGLFNSIIPNIIGPPRGDISESFVAAHVLMKDFLSAMLKNNSAFFEGYFSNFDTPACDTSFIWHARPNIPPLAIIKNEFLKKGIPYLDSLYSAQMEHTETPFSTKFITEFWDWVAWKKDPHYTTRKWLMEKSVESYPTSSRYAYSLGRYALYTGDTATAIAQYKAALSKLKEDSDPSLTAQEKATIQQVTTGQLQALKNRY